MGNVDSHDCDRKIISNAPQIKSVAGCCNMAMQHRSSSQAWIVCPVADRSTSHDVPSVFETLRPLRLFFYRLTVHPTSHLLDFLDSFACRFIFFFRLLLAASPLGIRFCFGLVLRSSILLPIFGILLCPKCPIARSAICLSSPGMTTRLGGDFPTGQSSICPVAMPTVSKWTQEGDNLGV
ncbi:unnamed protein product [Protopolystoma xenopodis]|uniref:Uncharacterized protein n=1 Tax=Protopolystoma xenopodis TaxID=117903 RepID=A0A448WG24_9PLAT|nr:unnamed protein product [Protopolystoma xenopodis]